MRTSGLEIFVLRILPSCFALVLFALPRSSFAIEESWNPVLPTRFRELLAVDAVADEALRKELGGDYAFLHTNHFSIAYAGEESAARYRGEILESVYAAFVSFFDSSGHPITLPESLLPVVSMPTREAFRAQIGGLTLSEQIEGIYLHEPNRAYFFDSVRREAARDQAQDVRRKASELSALRRKIESMPDGSQVQLIRSGGERRTYSKKAALRRVAADARDLTRQSSRYRENLGQSGIETMAHEGVHLLSFNLGVFSRDRPSPKWISEGIAMFFEPSRHGFLLETGAIHWRRVDQLNKAHARGERIELKRLLLDDALFGHDDTAVLAYDEAWSLVHFLATTRPEDLMRYLELLGKPGVDGSPANRLDTFRQAFDNTPESLEPTWREYMEKLVRGEESRATPLPAS